MALGDFDGDGLPDLAVASDGLTVLLDKLTASAKTSAGISLPTPSAILVNANYPGDSAYAGSTSGTTLISTATMATALALSANPTASSVIGHRVALTASLTPYSVQGFSTDGQGVTFFDGSSVLGTAVLRSGQATLNVSSLALGVHSLRTMYVTDGRFVSSTSPKLSFTVVRASTATTLTMTAGGSPVTVVKAGTVVTLTAAVTSDSMPLTVGQVRFCDATAATCMDIHLLGTAQLTSSGKAVLKLRPGPGVHKIKTTYLGTQLYQQSTSAVSTITVNGAPTTTVIAKSGSAGNYTLAAAVRGTGSSVAPGGSVSFVDTTNANTVLAKANLAPGTVTQTFGPEAIFATTNLPTSIAVGDFNGDGIPDLAVANSGITILLGKGDGSFTQTSFVARSTSLAVGDFDGNDKLDVVFTTDGTNPNDQTITVLLGKGDGTFSDPVRYPADPYSRSVAVADFNGDGALDVIVPSALRVTVWLGKADGSFNAPVQSPDKFQNGYSAPAYVAEVGDLNRDGKPDLALADATYDVVRVLLGKGDGTFNWQDEHYSTGRSPEGVAMGDLNGDGKLDLVVANSDGWPASVSVLLGNGDGTFRSQVMYDSKLYGVDSVAIADFNRDGKPDLVVAGVDVSLLLGKGDGTFNAPVVFPGKRAAMVAVGDLNGDGASDIAVTNTDSNTGGVLLGALTATANASVTGITVAPAGYTHSVKAQYPGNWLYTGSGSATTPITGAIVAAPAAAHHPSGRSRQGRSQ